MASDSLQIIISAVDRFSSVARSIQAQMGAIGKQANTIGKQVRGVGQAITLGVSAPIVAGLGFAAKSAIDLESAMADVYKVAGLSAVSEDAIALRESIIAASNEMPLAATEIAAITQAGAQLGIQLQDLGQFTELVAQNSVAMGIEAGAAGDAFAKVSNVYGLTIDQTASLFDAINHLGNNTAATAGEIIEVTKRAGAAATAFGLTAVETSALGASFIALGFGPERAGTAINSLLPRLQTAENQTGKFQDALERVGFTAAEFQAMVGEDATGAMDAFLASLSAMEGTARAGALADMFGMGVDSQAIGAAAGALDTVREINGLVAESATFAGSSLSEYEIRVQTTAAAMQTFRNRVTNAATAIGAVMLPAINDLLASVSPMAERFQEFAAANEPLVRLGLIIAGIVAVVGPVLVVIGSVISAIGTIASAVGFLGGVLATIGGTLSFLLPIISTIGTVVSLVAGAVVSAISLPAIAIAALVAGVVAAVAAIIIHWETLRGMAASIFSAISNTFTNAGSAMKTAIMSAVQSIIASLSGLASQAFSMGSRIVTGLADGIRSGIGAIRSAATSVTSAVANLLPNSPVPEGPLKILNGTRNTGYKITEMIAGGIARGSGTVGGAMAGAVTPGGGSATSVSGAFSPTVNINVASGADVSAIDAQLRETFADLFEQYSSERTRLAY